ncbi:MAG: lysylphosphatidylglycerol synthase domain-containing protein [Snowella sp.]|nr:lysylphosphatidylglycerol synthase domain-containing protein [Snowella sp.]
MSNAWKRIQPLAPSLLGLLLFILSIWAIHQEVHKYGWQDILASLQAISHTRLVGAIALMLINYVMLTGYDTLAMIYIRGSLSYWQTGFVGFISYAISNSVGLALLSGSAIRYRFYAHWGLNNPDIAKIIAFCNLSFWLGLLAVGGVTFLVDPLQVPQSLNLPFASVHPLGLIFLTLILAYLALSLLTERSLKIGRWQLPHLPFGLSLAQILITAIDWGLAAGILYVLLPTDANLSYAGFFGIYLLAQIAGVISNIPGGLGVFETVILLTLSPEVSSINLLGSLLAYRVIYYWIPLIVASLSLGGYELKRHFRA